MKQHSPFLVQVLIFSVIMIVSEMISYLLKPYLPAPSSVIGMVILFLLLCVKIVKLENVEELGMSLIDKIGFLFVPSGIAIVKSWDLMMTSGIQLTAVIMLTTIVLLIGTGLASDLILGKKSIAKVEELKKQIEQESEVK